MTKQAMRACKAVILAAALMMSGRSVLAQGAQSAGWPEESPAKKPGSAAVAIKPTPATTQKSAAVPSKPAAAAPKVSAPVKPVAPKPRLESAPAAAKSTPSVDAPAPAPAPMPVAKSVSSDAVAGEVVQALQQQADVLNRLATEIESQRSVMRDQQEKIKSLELKLSTPPAAAPKVAAAPPPPPMTVETASGTKLKFAGTVQGWYTASNGLVADTFRLRRTEIKFSGEMSPRVKWTLMVDPAKALSITNTTALMGNTAVVVGSAIGQSSRMLQDAFVSLNWKPSFAVEMGQQKIPLSLEGVQSSGKLETIERALFMSDKSRGVGYGDVRDLGVMVRGKVAKGQVEYSTGIFNGLGESLNDIDRNEQKSIVGRVVFRPTFIKGLQFGGSAAREEFAFTDVAARERQGVEALYTRGRFALKSELMGGRDAAVTRQGGYFQVTGKVTKPLVLLFRYDTFDPDTRSEKTAATVAERDWLGGFTYTLGNSGAWLQVNYIRKTFTDVVAPRNVFMTNVQTTW